MNNSQRDYKISVTEAELEDRITLRINVDLEFFHGAMPREVAVSWSGYLQAVGEWAPEANGALVTRLRKLLPPIENDPVEASSWERDP